MYCSPPMIRIGSVGASDTFSAGRASAFRRPTLSSIPTPALRVFGIPAANPGGGRLRAFDEDDVAFLQLEDLHDLGVDAHDPAPRIRGLRLGDPEELLAAGGHFQRVSSRGGTARAALAGLRNESALLELMSKPRNEK